MEKKDSDILGLRPFGEAAKIAAEKTFDGLGEFLGRICLPAAEEFGLLLQDHVRIWRGANLARVLGRTKEIFEAEGLSPSAHASPAIVREIIEEASWTDDDELTSLWAGLLTSACTESGRDESNKIFINILRQMTVTQVKVLILACERSTKIVFRSGVIGCTGQVIIPVTDLMDLSDAQDLDQLDRELDHMRQLGLFLDGLGGGIAAHSSPAVAYITPSGFALQMFVRCEGSQKSPIDFFGLERFEQKTEEVSISPTVENKA